MIPLASGRLSISSWTTSRTNEIMGWRFRGHRKKQECLVICSLDISLVKSFWWRLAFACTDCVLTWFWKYWWSLKHINRQEYSTHSWRWDIRRLDLTWKLLLPPFCEFVTYWSHVLLLYDLSLPSWGLRWPFCSTRRPPSTSWPRRGELRASRGARPSPTPPWRRWRSAETGEERERATWKTQRERWSEQGRCSTYCLILTMVLS